MAITAFNERFDETPLTVRNGITSKLRRFDVESDDGAIDDESAVYADSRCPQQGDSITLRNGTVIYAKEVAVSRSRSGRNLFTVNVQYDDEPSATSGDLEKGPGAGVGDPLIELPEVSFDSGEGRKVIEKDINGNPIWNRANDAFDPPYEIYVPAPMFTIQRNEGAFQWSSGRGEGTAMRSYCRRVNKTEFLGSPPRTLLLARIRSVKQWRLVNRVYVQFWKVVYDFALQDEGWELRPLNRGYHELVSGASGVKKQRIKINGEDAASPQLLNASGAWIPPSDIESGAQQPYFLEFKVYEEADFNQLNFGAIL